MSFKEVSSSLDKTNVDDLHLAKTNKQQKEDRKNQAQEEVRNQQEKRKLRRASVPPILQVASIGHTPEHIDELNGLPQRPIIEASFGATNIPYDTLIDSGADVNVMPYALFRLIPHVPLVSQQGSLHSFARSGRLHWIC